MNNPAIIHYKTQHEQVLLDLINKADIPALRIKDAIIYSLFPGGKRLRPMLVYLCGELFDTNRHSLDIIAASIELIHSFSLVHDDLPAMDNDDFRRGQPSCHRQFDEATAVLVGDGMQALAIDLLLNNLPSSLPMPQVVAVTHELVKACGPSGMVSGQSLDMSELCKQNISFEELSHIHSLKTGRLILACAKMVLAASQHSLDERKALQEFATHLGLFFQMQDDYLDRYDEANYLGKGRSSDIANEKQTFAYMYSKEILASLIVEQISKAKKSLDIFKLKAHNLVTLLDCLESRL